MMDLGKRKWWVLGALAVSLLTVGLDLTVLNLALPTIAEDLHASNSQLQWFADAYNLVLAAALLPAGLLGDRLGRKRMLIIALILFGAASAASAYAHTAGQLIAGRAALGLGAAFLLPLSMSIIPVIFTEQERSKAIGIWVTANSIGIPLGPIVGGWLLNNYSWGSVFLIDIPIIIVGLLAVSILLPESRSSEKPRVDLPGVLLSSIGLSGLTYGVIEVGEKGWGDLSSLLFILAGIVLLAVFIWWERRTAHALIDISLFRSPEFTWGSVLATLVSFAMFGILFVTPQYFQAVEGADAMGTGLRLLPIIGGLIVGAKVSDVITAWKGGKWNLLFGFLLLTGGMSLGATTHIGHDYGFTSIWISIVGLGIGFVLPVAMDTAISTLSAERSGVGSALIMALRQVGGAIGVALLGTVLSNGYHDKLNLDEIPGQAVEAVQQSVSAGAAAADQLHSENLLNSVRMAFIHGMDMMLWVCAGIAVLGLLFVLAFLHSSSERKETEEFGIN
ncbi:DHA2 family efflux MFS transporter permease subunit [Paenibacillus zeisoli]|uniref:DHA2 family efflux MFS transporter permease subunit n=1 Tax=Paenibacillus zeisoli TaxID=2496267 RepID=A0A3S1E117_9BACL|nr:MFS transporter [Paenibacillus zeisoli]RUT35497.1 DHA2 family efflux MFS transporter permease subunit [Paenibacillus zeisoli]